MINKKYMKHIAGLMVILCLVLYGIVIVSAKSEMRGKSPEKNDFAKVQDQLHKSLHLDCSGITVTPKATWLVSQYEGSRYDESEAVKGSFNLQSLMKAKVEEESIDSNSFYGQLMAASEEKNNTFISKLNKNGEFEQVAHLKGIGCLVSSYDGNQVIVLSNIGGDFREDVSDLERQSVVFETKDQGISWELRQEKFFPQAYNQAWVIKPVIYDEDNIWVWKPSYSSDENNNFEVGEPSGLYFSSDFGKTVQPIISTAKLYLKRDDIQNQVASDATWREGQLGEVERHIVQVDKNKAILWVSQTFMYGDDESPYVTGEIKSTSQAELIRKADQWEMTNVKRIDGLAIAQLVSNEKGKIISIQDHENDEEYTVRELRLDNLSWDVKGKLPRIFWPFQERVGFRNLWIMNDVLLVGTMNTHEVPRILLPSKWFKADDPDYVSAEAIFYSKDWGKSWNKLKIKAYHGVYGVNPKLNEVYWSIGDWYDTKDPNIYKHVID